MSVIVKDMNMPGNCGDCMFCYDSICVCVKDAGSICVEEHYYHGTKRPENCPLIELPDHGDLIDRDELMKHGVYMPMDGGNLPLVYMSYVKGAEAVIPAERSEE